MRSLHNLLCSHVSVKESFGPRTLAILQLSLTRIGVVNSDPPDLAGSQTVSLLLSIIHALNSCLLNLSPISCNYPIQHAMHCRSSSDRQLWPESCPSGGMLTARLGAAAGYAAASSCSVALTWPHWLEHCFTTIEHPNTTAAA